VIGTRTKLVCTIGPATADRIPELVAAGMDVARINFSHGTFTEHAAAARGVREANDRVALMIDLPGPKIRLGDLADDALTLEPGATFVLRLTDPRPGDPSGAHVSYPRLAADVRAGDRVLLADGAVELRVMAAEGDVRTEVVRGGVIRPHAGVSVPSDRLSEPPLTDADRASVPRAVEIGADFVAQSFVRRAADVAELRALLGSTGPPIVAKIETRPAVEDFDAICGVADAVMIARGDLGVELPYEEVPILQKQLVRRALDLGVPTIVATQMLESMIAASRPTRAEASDVANAIFDGADAIMLSGETAIGAHPVLAAEAAMRIARLCEEQGAPHLAPGAPPNAQTDADALAYAAVALAEADRDISAIACYTRSGRTARILSALRPRVPIVAFSPSGEVVRRLAMVHGVDTRDCVQPDEAQGRLGLMAWLVGEDPSFVAGSAVVLVASTAEPGTGPNMLEVHRVGEGDGV
jgi:pyruvate kinase